jgi:hypothetical protein
MFTTTLAVIALAGGIGSGVIPSTPNWHTDYAQALTRSSAEGKPMAVFIGHGSDRITKMLVEGTISAEAAKVLATSYVSVYLDSDAQSGRDLAGRFEMSQGLIISSRGGALQAFRMTGELKAAELAESLTKYATADQPVTTVNGDSGVVYTGSGVVSPSTYSPRYVYPSSGYSYPQFSTYPSMNCTGFK